MSLTDRWVSCRLGHTHWGSAGAAGLLVLSPAGEVLLQQRAPWVDHGDTWGIPSGAMHLDETPSDAAVREAIEEIAPETGRLPGPVEHLEVITDDHANWAFHTVVVRTHSRWDLSQIRGNAEVGEEGLAWVTWGHLDAQPGSPASGSARVLHPGFAASVSAGAFTHLARL